MIVCHCEAVSDRQIRKAVRKGASTMDEVAEACGVGAGCGGCLPEVERLVCGGDAPAVVVNLAS